jgi:hypothetical protein
MNVPREGLDLGEMTQAHFEGLVRELWDYTEKGTWRVDIEPFAMRIAVLAMAATHQPDLLTGRAAYNLGAKKMKFVRRLMEQKL